MGGQKIYTPKIYRIPDGVIVKENLKLGEHSSGDVLAALYGVAWEGLTDNDDTIQGGLKEVR